MHFGAPHETSLSDLIVLVLEYLHYPCLALMKLSSLMEFYWVLSGCDRFWRYDISLFIRVDLSYFDLRISASYVWCWLRAICFVSNYSHICVMLIWIWKFIRMKN